MSIIRETLQTAKVGNRFVRIVMREFTIERARVIDVDGSSSSVLVGERDRRRVHEGDIVNVTLL